VETAGKNLNNKETKSSQFILRCFVPLLFKTFPSKARVISLAKEARGFSTPHPGPLLVWRGEGEIFCGTMTQGVALGCFLSGFPPASDSGATSQGIAIRVNS
jgi:hypothetical protein